VFCGVKSVIKTGLEDMNPWWKEDFELDFKKREVYEEIKKFLPLPQIIVFTGLRRVGKTTLMLKIVEDFINKGFNPRNILYFSFDEFQSARLREIIKTYEELMDKSLRSEKYLFLFDEIQKLNDWENQLKTVYDAFGKNIKIIISGSESLFIRKKSKEALAGRAFEFKVNRLSFKEFLAFKGLTFKPLALYERELKKLFNEFMITQGFPELVGIKDKKIVRKYVNESIIEKIIFRDIPSLFRVSDTSIIKSLLDVFREEPGQLMELSKLSKELGVSRQTISNYITYLERSFLVKKLYNFSRNKRKVERKLKKYYPAVVSVDLLFNQDDLSRSRVFEWLIVDQLKAEFFWRDPYKNEVDVVVVNDNLMPVEIKRGRISVKGLRVFMRRFNVRKGWVVSWDEEGQKRVREGVIRVMPAYKFLLKTWRRAFN